MIGVMVLFQYRLGRALNRMSFHYTSLVINDSMFSNRNLVDENGEEEEEEENYSVKAGKAVDEAIEIFKEVRQIPHRKI